LSNERYLIAYIPGFGHKLQKNSEVMVRGGRVPDMPGCHYHVLRNKKDHRELETIERTQRRSKFGIKRIQSTGIQKQLKKPSAQKVKRREFLKHGFVLDKDVLEARLGLIQTNFIEKFERL